ncbi:MAG TPA: amidase [Candidatus Limnocylindria bacterium]|nr:amidase [Candidatus Limnocylindria bacterium]
MHEAAALLRARRVSSAELTRACVARIERLDRELVAFITRTLETAMEDATRADAELARGVDRGALHGIPVALKDLYDQRGVVTTAGSKIFAGNVATEDSAVTERLRTGGAVLLGKTNLHEWAFGVTNQNPHFGNAKNPWDPARIPGGSSGGSAIAVATGMCFVSPGSDTGGSIRIPAALCGIAGLKPTFGRVSLRGVVPLAWSLDHAGPLGRSVRDLALTLAAIAGYDPRDPASCDVPVEDYVSGLEEGVKGLRILVATDHFFADLDSEVERAVREAAAVLASFGARLVERGLPSSALLLDAQRAIIASDAAAYHRDHMREHPNDFGPFVLERMQAGEKITGADLAIARRRQSEIRRAWCEVLREVDLVLAPTTAVPALPREDARPAGERDADAARRLTRNTSPFNLTGLPAVSVPCGFTKSGLPIGLQLATGPWREALLLRAARAYERATDWHLRHPAQ